MNERWLRELNEFLHTQHHGLAVCDLDDDTQAMLTVLANQGLAPAEAFQQCFDGWCG